MNQTIVDVGDAVRITAGAYKGFEGVVEDKQLNCDTVRVSTNEGLAYCFVEDAVRLAEPTRSSYGKAILKKK